LAENIVSRTRRNARCSANGVDTPGLGATGDQDSHSDGFGENQWAGASGAAQGTRASANTSGPDFTWAKIAGEIADLKIRTERRKLCFFCRTGFRESELFRKCDPAV
jgi:hypothetical protein